jgi:CheY-like chemotaxis protein
MEAVEAIEAAGFDVIEAADADQAIAILEQRSDILLIFTDVRCRGRWTGSSCLFREGPLAPIKIVATSGYAKVRESDLPAGSRFSKPYAATEITNAIGQLIRP